MTPLPIERLVNLLDPTADVFLNVTREVALARMATGDPQQIRSIEGQFALVQKTGRVLTVYKRHDHKPKIELPRAPRARAAVSE